MVLEDADEDVGKWSLRMRMIQVEDEEVERWNLRMWIVADPNLAAAVSSCQLLAMDTSEDFRQEEIDMNALEEDCHLLGSLLDDSLKLEIGDELFRKVEKLRTLAKCTADLGLKGDPRLAEELMSLPLDEALPLTRACGHYLNLTAIAELQDRLRRNRKKGGSSQSCDVVMGQLVAQGISPEVIYERFIAQTVEIVLTAHPTQVNRRTLQYKHTRIASLLPDLTQEEQATVVADLIREVASLWQTDELRRQKPTPLDEARGGLNIVEQSLWSAVPVFMRRASAALKKHTGHDMPLNANPFKFASWMGGDRDGNPNVISKIDILRFELSMNQCSREVWLLTKQMIRDHTTRTDMAAARAAGEKSEGGAMAGPPALGSSLPTADDQIPLGSLARDTYAISSAAVRPRQAPPALGPSLPTADYQIPLGSLARDTYAISSAADSRKTELDGMPDAATMIQGDSDCEYDGGRAGGLYDKLDALCQVGEEDEFKEELLEEDIISPMASCLSLSSPSKLDRGYSFGPMAAPELSMKAYKSLASTLDRSASIGLTDPTALRKTLRNQRGSTAVEAFRTTHDHPGFHPYRIVLGDVREKLMNTRKRMENLLNGQESDGTPFYETEEELERPLRAIYWSLYECSGGVIADGRLLDLIRRVSVFGMSMMKLDIRQESTRHAEAIDAITTYLGYGSYLEMTEEERLAFLTKELKGRRPLIPQHMPMSAEVMEERDGFLVGDGVPPLCDPPVTGTPPVGPPEWRAEPPPCPPALLRPVGGACNRGGPPGFLTAPSTLGWFLVLKTPLAPLQERLMDNF
eukprot:gene2907-4965_t